MNTLTTFRNLLLDIFFHDFLTAWAAFRARDLYTRDPEHSLQRPHPAPTNQEIETLAYQEAERYYQHGWIAFLLKRTGIGTRHHIIETYAKTFISSYERMNHYTQQARYD
ncbi:MAG TPA: hypothetical protein VEL31_32020 [Ktedonobacteraceae bacterium]|nr:hypothetical protein [Ktedonobacteraceae bacterium]